MNFRDRFCALKSLEVLDFHGLTIDDVRSFHDPLANELSCDRIFCSKSKIRV